MQKDTSSWWWGTTNAYHTAWGYHKTDRKGTTVHDTAQHHQLTLWTDQHTPTRIMNSVSRDTNPDLTFTVGISQVEWTRLEETLGSDHHLVQTEITYKRAPLKIGKAKIADWTAFRKDLTQSIEDLDEWTRLITEKSQKHTKEIQLTVDKPAVDSHRLYLWEARRSLICRWKKQKWDRVLKKRIALLTRQADKYADELVRQNWNQICDNLQGTLSTRNTWNIIRSLALEQNEIKDKLYKEPEKIHSQLRGLGR